MFPSRTVLRDGAIAGSVASVVSSAALVVLSKIETGYPFAAINATSHWLWNGESFRQDTPSLRYTLTGYGIHHLASIFWGVVVHQLFPERAFRPAAAMVRHVVVTTVAASVGDYLVVPKRLTPGVETRLSRGAVGLFYLSFAAGLAAGMTYVRAISGADRPPWSLAMGRRRRLCAVAVRNPEALAGRRGFAFPLQ